MRTRLLLLSLILAVAPLRPVFADSLKINADADLVKHLSRLMKCGKGDNPTCNLKFRGLDLEFADMKNPDGGAIAVIELGGNQNYSDYGRRCVMIEFSDRDMLIHGMAAKGIGIIFRDDGYITHNYKNPDATSKCE